MTKATFIFALAVGVASACSPASTPPPNASADKAPAPSAVAESPASGQPNASGAAAGAPASPTGAQAQPSASALQPPGASAPPTGDAGQVSPSPPASAPRAPEPPVLQVREVTIPTDTLLTVSLETPIASDTSNVEEPIRGTLAKPIVVSGRTVVPAGAEVSGTVIDTKGSGRVKGRASIAFRFDGLTVHGEHYRIRTARVTRAATSSKKDDLTKGGIGAAAGAIVGGIADGGRGAVIGGGIGAAGTVLATKGKEVRLAAGTTFSTRLQEAVKVMVSATEK